MKMIKLSIDLDYRYRKAPRLDIYEGTFKIKAQVLYRRRIIYKHY